MALNGRTFGNSKYKAKKTEIDGIVFDSKKESLQYLVLKKLQDEGKITNLRLQVPYTLIDKSAYGREIKYVADFVFYRDGRLVVQDVKGFKTPVYMLKKRLLAERYQIVIEEV